MPPLRTPVGTDAGAPAGLWLARGPWPRGRKQRRHAGRVRVAQEPRRVVHRAEMEAKPLAPLDWTADDAEALMALFEAAEREVEEAEADGGDGAGAQEEEVVDIAPYLQKVPTKELRKLRMLATLCNMVYYLRDVTPHSIERRFNLKYVTSSVEMANAEAAVPPRDHGDDAEEGGAPGGAAAAAPPPSGERADTNGDGAPGAVDAYDAPAGEDEVDADTAAGPRQRLSSLMQSVNQRVTPLRDTLSQRVSTIKRSSLVASAAAKGGGAAVATITAAMSAVSGAAPLAAKAAARMVSEAADSLEEANESDSAPPKAAATALAASLADPAANATTGEDPSDDASASAEPPPAAPVEWFVADDEATNTRYIIIEGSNNVASWRSNLAFDPVDFEDPKLGVKVHRGMYEAALSLYGKLLPLIDAHFRRYKSGTAHLCFSGHSLGGSIATLLSLMLHHRQVLAPGAQRPVCTFGAASVFCDAEACANGSCEMATDMTGRHSFLPSGGPTADMTFRTRTSVLAKLGLPPTHVKNVIMNYDIVPRAFTCDYSLVANLLQSVNPVAFKEHSCLNGPRQLMYLPCGETLVLQPQKDHRFNTNPPHPMLPVKGGCWMLAEPRELRQVFGGVGGTVMGKAGRPQAANVMDAYFAFLNTPHPLETLGDPAAYGPDGLISRYHNPFHYCLAIAGILRAQRNAWRVSIAIRARHAAGAALGGLRRGGGGGDAEDRTF